MTTTPEQEEVWEQIRRDRPRTMLWFVFVCCPLLDPGMALVVWFFVGGGTREFGDLCIAMLLPLTFLGVLLWFVRAPGRNRG